MQKLELTQKFSLESKDVFEKAYSSLKFPLSEHSFAWIYLWDSCYKDIEWRMINGNLCLFLTFEGNRYVWGPVLPGSRLGETIGKCFSLCEDYNVNNGISKKPALMYIPEELKGDYASLEGFELEEQNQDYIYKTRDVIELSGRKYQDKRNKRNFFVKNHNFVVEEYSAARHKKGCIDLLERWEKQKEAAVKECDKEKFEAELDANKKVLDYAESFGIKGMVVLVDGIIEGLIFGNRTNERICTMFFGKTNLQVKGLSQFIYGEFLKRFFSNCELVNDMEDWDVSYLRHSKFSYKPLMVKKSHKLVKSA